MCRIEHQPVMVKEVLDYFQPLSASARICDATVGLGGHSAAILSLCPSCTVVGIDVDKTMLDMASDNVKTQRMTFVHGWFDEVIQMQGRFDRILMDLGISMVHLTSAQRGFSFMEESILDMRLSQEGETAASLIRRISEKELANIIFLYGNERYSRRIARAIIQARGNGLLHAHDLAKIIRSAVPAKYCRGRIHPATRTFQALRIAVNDEIDRLRRALPLAAAALNDGGRLAVMSFHSGEDREVKQIFRMLSQYSADELNTPMLDSAPASKRHRNTSTDESNTPMLDRGMYHLLTRKPITASEEEILQNPASRSAKLRVIERSTRRVA